MIHPEREQDLLLLAHDALSPWPTLRTRWHLTRCPDCRHRLAQMETASLGLAGVIRGPGLPRWSPPTACAPILPVLWVLLVTTALLLIVLGTMAVRSHSHAVRTIPTGNCRPDLPNDRCR